MPREYKSDVDPEETAHASVDLLLHALISQVDVCDKVEVSSSDPSLDSSYYSSFTYTLLDGSGEEISFDSTPAKNPTGEVQVGL